MEQPKKSRLPLLARRGATSTPVEEPKETLQQYVDRFWKPGLYARKYANLAENLRLKTPNDGEVQQIYREQLKKESLRDELNCALRLRFLQGDGHRALQRT